jgi:hypothetical protein
MYQFREKITFLVESYVSSQIIESQIEFSGWEFLVISYVWGLKLFDSLEISIFLFVINICLIRLQIPFF